MSNAKWVSLACGSLGAALGAALLLYLVSLRGLNLPMFQIGMTAIGAGALVGLVHWKLLTRHDEQLRRLITYTESLRSDAEAPNRPIVSAEYEALLTAVHEAVGDLRARLERAVTQRRELEAQVRIAESQRRRAAAVLDSLDEAVIVTDAFDDLALVNTAAERLFGFERGAALRSPVAQAVRERALVQLMRDAAASGGAGAAVRRQVQHALAHQGQQRHFSVTVAGLGDDQGAAAGQELAGVVAILRDVTREKEIAEMKSDFVSNVSHELRTPLSSIKAYMEMLVDGEATSEQTRGEFYQIIQGETNRLSRLIDNILNISRIEAGMVRVQREHFLLTALVKEAVDVMQAQARAKGIDLSLAAGAGSPAVVADQEMIQQAVMNLVSNAIKYTGAGGRVEVSLAADAARRRVTLRVTDTGVGVPSEDVPHLFEKFYRVKDHKNLAKGSGLGLNLVKHVIETVHGGELGVSSRVGHGSTFWFALPLAGAGQ